MYYICSPLKRKTFWCNGSRTLSGLSNTFLFIMKHVELKGTARVFGRKADVKSVRKSEQVPCVIYGNGIANTAFSVDAKAFNLLITTPYSHIIDLDIDGTKYMAKLQAVQYHPVTDAAIHADFLAISNDKPVTIEVPVKTTGNAEGVKAGGKLFQAVRKLKISALEKNLPDEITVDVTPLGIGQHISAGDLKFDNFQIVSPKAMRVCSILSTRAAATAAPAGEEAAAPEAK